MSRVTHASTKVEVAHSAKRWVHAGITITVVAVTALTLGTESASASRLTTQSISASATKTVQPGAARYCMFRALGGPLTFDEGTKVVTLQGGDEVWADVNQTIPVATYENFYGYSLRYAAYGWTNLASLTLEYC